MKADIRALISFYDQKWEDIRQSDNLDWRIMVVLLPIYTSIFGIAFYFSTSLYPIFLVVTVNSCLAWYGMWMTIRSYVKMLNALIDITQVERELKLGGLVSQTGSMPSDSWSFLKKFSVSRRFPLFVTYSILMFSIPIGLSFLFENILMNNSVTHLGPFSLFGYMGFLIGSIIWLFLTVTVIYFQVNDYLENTVKPCPKCKKEKINVRKDYCKHCEDNNR